MKKWFYATVVLAFIAGPAFANEFEAEQMKTLDTIRTQLEQFKNDPNKQKVLTEQKECVEKTADLDGIKICFAIFPLEPSRFLEK